VLHKQLTVSTGLCKVPYKYILSAVINENHVGIISIAGVLKRYTLSVLYSTTDVQKCKYIKCNKTHDFRTLFHRYNPIYKLQNLVYVNQNECQIAVIDCANVSPFQTTKCVSLNAFPQTFQMWNRIHNI